MIEIIDIILLFCLFSIFLLAPLNIFTTNNFNLRTNNKLNMYFNIIINLNILLLISIMPLKLIDYIYLIYLVLFIFLIKNYLLNFKKYELKRFYLNILIFFSVYFIISIDVSAKLNLSWDSKWFWYIKSLFFYQNNTFKELSFYPYNDFHPHFGSYIWAFFRKISFNEHEYFGRLFYVFLYLLSLMLVVKDLFKKNIYNLIFFLTLIILHYRYYYLTGLQELLLFSLLILNSKFIFDYLDSRKIISLFFIGLCLNLILWIKAEGIAFFIISMLCINFVNKLKFNHRVKFNTFMILLIIFKIVILKIFNIKLNNQPYYLDYLSSINFDLLFYKVLNISIYLLYNSLLNGVLLILPIIILINYKKIFKDEFLKTNFIFFLLNICFIFSAYILRDMEVVYSLKTTIDRLVFASSGFYLFYVVINIKKLLPKTYQ